MGNASGVRAGQAYVEIATKQGLFDKGMASVQASMKRLAAVAGSIGNITAGGFNAAKGAMSSFAGGVLNLKSAIVGSLAVTGLAAWIKGFADAGSQLDDMSQRTGMAASSLSALGYAAKLSGSDLETVEKATRKMQVAIASAADVAGKDARKKLLDLGTSYEQLAAMNPEQQFLIIAQKLSEIKDPAQQANAALEIFGKTGASLIPMLKDGSKGIEKLMEEATQLGLVMSDKDAAAAGELGDTLDRLWAIVGAIRTRVVGALVPSLIKTAEWIYKIVPPIMDWLDANRELIVTVFKVGLVASAAAVAMGMLASAGLTILGVVAAIVPVAAGVMAVIEGISLVIGALLTPAGLLFVAISTGIVYALQYFGVFQAAWDILVGKFNELYPIVQSTVDGIKKAFSYGNLAGAVEVAMLGIELAARTAFRDIYAGFQALVTEYMNTSDDMGNYVVDAFITTGSSIMDLWDYTVTGIIDAFANLQNVLMSIWDSTINFISKKLLYLYSLFDQSFEYQATVSMMDEDYKRAEKARNKSLESAQAGRANQNATASEERAKLLKENRNAIYAGSQDLKGSRIKEEGKNVSGFDRRIQELRDQLTAANEKIDEEYTQSQDSPKPTRPKTPTLPELAAVGQRADKTLGTFSGFTAGMIGGATSSFDKLLGESKLQTELLGTIAGNTKDGGSSLTLED